MDAWTSAGSIHDKADALDRGLAGRGVAPALAGIIAHAYLERAQTTAADSFFAALADHVPAGVGSAAALDGEAQARLILAAAVAAAPAELVYATAPLTALLAREPVDLDMFGELEQRIRAASSAGDPTGHSHAAAALKRALYYGKRYATFLGQRSKDPASRWPLWVADEDVSQTLVSALAAAAGQQSLARACGIVELTASAFDRPSLQTGAPEQAPAAEPVQLSL